MRFCVLQGHLCISVWVHCVPYASSRVSCSSHLYAFVSVSRLYVAVCRSLSLDSIFSVCVCLPCVFSVCFHIWAYIVSCYIYVFVCSYVCILPGARVCVLFVSLFFACFYQLESSDLPTAQSTVWISPLKNTLGSIFCTSAFFKPKFPPSNIHTSISHLPNAPHFLSHFYIRLSISWSSIYLKFLIISLRKCPALP